jgi:Putative MetA-pathway of phenol degradation
VGLHAVRFAALVLVIFLSPLRGAVAFAGRPSTIDDVEPVGPGRLEIELGLYQGLPDGAGRDQKGPVTALAYGVLERLELGLAIQRINQDVSPSPAAEGFEDLHINAKYKFLEETNAYPALAVTFDIKLPTASRSKGLSTGKTDETLLWIASKSFAPLALHANLGYMIVGNLAGAKLRNRLRGGSSAEWALDRQWSMVGELSGASRAEIGGKNEADFQLGFRYALRPTLVFDFAGGRSLRSSGTTVQGTFGLTWTIDRKSIVKR